MLWHSHEWAGGLGEERTGGAPEDEDRAAEILSRWADKADRWERGRG